MAFYNMNFNPFDKDINVKYGFKSNDLSQVIDRLNYLKQIKGPYHRRTRQRQNLHTALVCRNVKSQLVQGGIYTHSYIDGHGFLQGPMSWFRDYTAFSQGGYVQRDPG